MIKIFDGVALDGAEKRFLKLVDLQVEPDYWIFFHNFEEDLSIKGRLREFLSRYDLNFPVD